MQLLQHFLGDTHIATRWWYPSQFCNDEHLRQGDIPIAGQGTVNNMAEEHQSESGGNDKEEDDDVEGEGVEW
jgi:hypothetical protein